VAKHEDPAHCANRVDVTNFGDSHPSYVCGCTPNVVHVKGRYNSRARKWFYYVQCDLHGEHSAGYSASLFHLVIDKANRHARGTPWPIRPTTWPMMMKGK
jgi:hypothetical protein